MRAVVFPGSSRVELVEKPKPSPAAGEVLIAMRAAGVCGSDLHFMHASAEEQRHSTLGTGLDRDPALTPGHEIAGVVESVGDGVTALSVGDRVTVNHYSGCGRCRYCRMGWDTMCADKIVYTLKRDGGYQDFVAVRERDCTPIPDGLSFAVAAFIACGAGTSFQALRRTEIKAGDTLAAVGLGPVGLSGLMWGAAMGARTIGLDTNEERCAFARERGVDHVLNPLSESFAEDFAALTPRGGADAVIETAGNSPGRRLALDVARPWGTTVFVSFGDGCDLDAAQQIVQRQITLRGSWMFDMATLMDALEFADRNRVPLESIVTTRCTIEEAPAAILRFADGASGKTVVEWAGTAG